MFRLPLKTIAIISLTAILLPPVHAQNNSIKAPVVHIVAGSHHIKAWVSQVGSDNIITFGDDDDAMEKEFIKGAGGVLIFYNQPIAKGACIANIEGPGSAAFITEPEG